MNLKYEPVQDVEHLSLPEDLESVLDAQDELGKRYGTWK